MKKKILLIAFSACFSIGSLIAQDMQRQTPEERTKATIEKMAPLKLDTDIKAKANVIIAEFYTAQQDAMKEMRANGNASRETVQAKRKELADARDGKLKLILKQEQYQKWIDEIEPSLRPQRQKN